MLVVNHTIQMLRWSRENHHSHGMVNIAGNDQCADSECHCPVCHAARKLDAGDSKVPYAGQSGINLAVANHLASGLEQAEFLETHVMLQICESETKFLAKFL